GLWLIGGALLLSAVVLAWAFQGDTPARSVHRPRSHVAARASGGVTPVADVARSDGELRDHGEASGALSGRSAPKGQWRLAGGNTPGSLGGRGGETPGLGDTLGDRRAPESAEPRAPSASNYALLLEGNAFRPRIVPRRAGGSGRSAHPAEPKAARRPGSDGNGA